MSMKKSVCIRWGSALLLSVAVMLAFASHTSPVYELLLGDYGENAASAAMLIGKSWAEGAALPYRDLFAMGGPLYFLIQAAGWFAAGRTGIFVLEVLSFALFLGLTGETVRRFASKAVTAGCMVLGAVLYAALSAAGDSAFEWCLPFVAGGLLIALRPGQVCRSRDAALIGLLCGCVLLMDFRAGGLLYGAAFWAVFFAPKGEKEKTWKRLTCCLAGAALPVLIAAAAFAAAGSLTGMVEGTFLYPARALLDGFDSLLVVLHKGVKCLFLLPLLAAGVLLLAKGEPQERPLGVCALLSGALCGIFLLCGDNRWYYYLSALPAAPLGIALLRPKKGSLTRLAAGGMSLLLTLGLSAAPLKNTLSFLRAGVPDVICEFYADAQSFWEENPDYRYIAIDTDCTYFLLLDKLPACRYFTGQTELSAYDPAVAEAVEGYLSGEPAADILFITQPGYIGRALDKYTLIQVYLEYGGSLFVYLPNQ